MKRCLALIAVAACTSADAPDDGVALPACHECGPGAVMMGRFVASEEGPQPIVANRQGTVARVKYDTLSWLGADFTTEDETSFDQGVMDIAIDDAGGTAITSGSFSEYMWNDAVVIGFAPGHTQSWRQPLGSIVSANLIASPNMIAMITDAKQVGTTPITDAGGFASTLVGLRPSDGSVAWHMKNHATAMAFAPDGTLLIGGSFANTLDLGGTATPITTAGIDGFVAAIDPMTGLGRWVVQLDSMGSMTNAVESLAVGPTGEVAVGWTTNFDAPGGSVIMIENTGVVRWTQALTGLGTVSTDGEHVIVSGDSFAQFSATGMDWQRAITGAGSHGGQVLALAGTRLIAAIASTQVAIGTPTATTMIGDVTYSGDGYAVVELAH